MGEALSLAVLLTLKDEFSSKLDDVKKKLPDTRAAMLGVGAGLAAGVGVAVAALANATKSAAEEQVGIERLRASVEASGAAWDEASEAIEGYLEAELKRTALDDGEGREAISRLTQATGDYKQALDLMGITQDLAAAKGMSLTSAAELVGKVANGNVAVLKRYGIELEEGATAQEALAAMQAKFAGQAEAYGNTTQGAMQRLDIALGNVKETIGAAVLPTVARLATVIADLAQRAIPWIENAIQNLIGFWNKNRVVILAGLAALAVAIMVQVVPAFIAMAGAAMASAAATMTALAPIVIPVLAVVAAVAALKKAWDSDFGGMQTKLKNVWENTLKPAFEALKQWFTETLPEAVALVRERFEEAWGKVREAISAVWDFLRDVFEKLKTWFTETLPDAVARVRERIEEAWDRVRDAVRTVWDFLRDVFEKLKTWFVSLLPDAARELYNAVTTHWQNVKAGISLVRDGLVLIFESLKTWFTETLPGAARDLYESVRARWDDIQSSIEIVWGRIKEALEAFRTWFTETLPGAARNAKEGILGAIGELAGRLIEAWYSIIETARQWWDWLVETIINAFRIDWGQVGRDVIAGIISGLNSAVGALLDAAARIVNNVIGAMKRALGIGSPSRVAQYAVGLPIAEGILQGIIDGLRSGGLDITDIIRITAPKPVVVPEAIEIIAPKPVVVPEAIEIIAPKPVVVPEAIEVIDWSGGGGGLSRPIPPAVLPPGGGGVSGGGGGGGGGGGLAQCLTKLDLRDELDRMLEKLEEILETIDRPTYVVHAQYVDRGREVSDDIRLLRALEATA